MIDSQALGQEAKQAVTDVSQAEQYTKEWAELVGGGK